MRIDNIINKKAGNDRLSRLELSYAVNSFVSGKLSEEKMAELLKIICHTGMTYEETYDLTQVMLKSGKTLSLKALGETFDKHSSGGVSDSTTLLVVPMLASLGLSVLKMSGKSLGYTGGTIDKLLSLGVNPALSIEEATEQVKAIKEAIISQTQELVPADGKIYALRDKIGAVESLPLIASSIVSKKLAGGAKNIVLDVKCGNGAFMKKEEKAVELGSIMLRLLKASGRKAVCLITDMNQPLGYSIGARAEAEEVIELLQNPRSCLLLDLSVALATELAVMSGKFTKKKAKLSIEKNLSSGVVFQKFKELILAEGGSEESLEKKCKSGVRVLARTSGYVRSIDTKLLGELVHEVCSSGEALGVKTHFKIGDRVEKGKCFLEIFASKEVAKKYSQKLLNSFEISTKICKKPKLILKRLTGEENEA